MAGSIDPRCETLRGTHWPVKVAGVFGTRVAENHLGQRFKATASTGRTYGCKRSDHTLKNSCGTGAVHIWPAVQSDRINRPDIWMQAIRSHPENLLRHGGRPHMASGSKRPHQQAGHMDASDPITP